MSHVWDSAKSSNSWAGYFINLDRSADRRTSIEDQLERAGIAHCYSRFRAVDGRARTSPTSQVTPGELGCFESHAAVLAQSGHDGTLVHILEDDALIPPSFAGHIERVIASARMRDFDIVYTDLTLTSRAFDYGNLRRLKAAYDNAMAARPHVAFKLIELRAFPFCGTISYFVTPGGMRKVRALLEDELKAGPALPIDLFYQQEINAGNLKAACIFPFVTTVNFHHSGTSTIRNDPRPVDSQKPHPSQAEIIARKIGRYAFFVDCDLQQATTTLAPLLVQRAREPHLGLLADIQRILISCQEEH